MGQTRECRYDAGSINGPWSTGIALYYEKPDTKPVVYLDPHGLKCSIHFEDISHVHMGQTRECRYDAGSIIGPWAIGIALYYEKPDTKPVVNLDPHGRGECRYDAGSIIGPWAIGTALYYEKPDTKPVVYHPWSTGISVPDTKKEPLGSFRIDS